MIGFNRKKICTVAIYLLLIFVAKAQPGCPAVNAGNDVSLPCGVSCTTLTAKPFDAGATSSYSVSSIPYTPFSYTAGTAVLVNIDDIWGSVINLPFNFCFFDHVYNQAVFGSNGIITFDTYRAGGYNNWNITACNPVPDSSPADSFFTNSIMCPYQDIDPELGGTITYQIIGAAPCRTLVVSYYDVPLFDSDLPSSNCYGTTNATSQAVIYETTNVIEIYIQDKASCTDWNGGLAYEGIIDSSGANAFTVPGRNLTVFNATNDAYRFTPNGPSIVNVSWYQGATQIAADSVVQVCPSAPSTVYTAKAVYTPCAGGTPVTVTDNVTVTLPGTLDAGIDSFKNISCFGLTDGKIYAHVSGGNAPVTYGWSNGSTALTLNNLSAGTYTFTANDAANCLRSSSVVITQPAQLLATISNGAQIICTGNGLGALTVATTGGTIPYTYNWNNGEHGVRDSLLTSGTYIVTVTDLAACTVTANGTFTITIDSVALGAPIIKAPSCFGGNNGSIIANVTSGYTPYQYAWSTLQSGDTAINLPQGAYTVTVTDAGACTATATYNVTQPTRLFINAPVLVNIGCSNTATGSITANPTGGTPNYTYNWTEQSNSQALSGITINNLIADTYTLTVTDANGCTDSASYQITQFTPLTFNTSTVIPSCNGGSNGTSAVSITSGTPPYLFSWDGGTAITDSTISNLSAGPLDVVVTDANNCLTEATIQINQPTPVAVQFVSKTNVLCNGGSNGTITVGVSGGTPGAYTFNWSNLVTGATDTALAAGTYGVLATDVNGCTAAQTYTITQPTAISINQPNIQNIGCSGGNTGAITANVTQGTPGYTYNWVSQPAGQLYTGQTINNLGTGDYHLLVTDTHGCMDTATYTITAIPLLRFTVSATNVSCFGGNNGSAKVSITSGTPPYQFSWNNGAYGNDSNIVNLTADSLQINVTDANTCLTDTTISISQPTQIVIQLTGTRQTNVLCNGGNNGELVVTASGGTPGYTFNWSNQFIGTDNTTLTAGNYMLIVVDNNACADTATYVITQPTPVVATPIVTNAVCYAGTGSINANPSGGVPAYSFLWSNGETTQIAGNLVTGAYDCTVTDANGCRVIAIGRVNQPAQLLIRDTTYPVLCIGQKTGKIVILSTTGDTPPYAYNATQDHVNFVTATAAGVIQGLDTGIYTIQITDSFGCTAEAYAFIPNATPDGFYMPVVDSTLCYGPDYNDGAVLVLDSPAVNNVNGPFRYGIDGSALQDTGYFQNLSAGPHVVTAVNANGCVDSIPVVVPQPLPIVVAVTPDSLILPLGGSQSVMVTYLNATDPTYNWTNTSGFSCTDCPNPVVSSYAPGTYQVTVSMVNGTVTCYGSTTLYVSVLSHTKAFAPNAFSPNGDGNNDIFQIYGEDIKTVSLKVFNRWGELVYSTTNSLAGWDGTCKGVLQMPSVFTYEAVITYLDDSKENKNGTITLIR